jgi:hypothetical protein
MKGTGKKEDERKKTRIENIKAKKNPRKTTPIRGRGGP